MAAERGRSRIVSVSLTARHYQMQTSRIERFYPFLVLALVIVVARPLFTDQLIWGHNCTIDYARLLELDHLVREGVPYPRWCPDLYFGYGSPLFNFYAPGGYWIGEIFSQMGIGLLYSQKLVYFLALLLAGMGMFLFARRLWGPLGATASALVYVFSPYFLLDVYVRSSLGEALSFAWIPLALYFFHRGLAGERWALVTGALFTGLLIFTHNISALLFFPALMLFILVHAVWRRDARSAVLATGSCGIAFALSAFFWLPALVEKPFVLGDRILTTDAYAIARNFVGLRRLFEPRWGFGTGDPGDAISLQLGILHWALLVAAGTTFFRRLRDRSPSVVFLWIVLATAIFCTLRPSKFLWDALPLVRFVQFPWRLLLFATFAASALAGSVFTLLQKKSPRWQLVALGTLVVAALLAYGGYARAKLIVWDGESEALKVIEPEERETLLANPKIQSIDEYLTIERMRQIGIRGTILTDFLPVWVREPHLSMPQGNHRPVEGRFEVETLREGPQKRSYRIRSATGGYLEFFTFWFPGWVGWLDGEPVDLASKSSTGCLGVTVPPGEHMLTMEFVNTPVRTAGERISLGGLVAAAILFVGTLAKRRRK